MVLLFCLPRVSLSLLSSSSSSSSSPSCRSRHCQILDPASNSLVHRGASSRSQFVRSSRLADPRQGVLDTARAQTAVQDALLAAHHDLLRAGIYVVRLPASIQIFSAPCPMQDPDHAQTLSRQLDEAIPPSAMPSPRTTAQRFQSLLCDIG